MIVLTYVNNFIIVGPYMLDINVFFRSMKNGCEFFYWPTREKKKKIGIEMTQLDENRFNIYQTFIIERIIYFLNIKKTTMVCTPTLSQHQLEIPYQTNIYLEICTKNNGTTKQQSVC